VKSRSRKGKEKSKCLRILLKPSDLAESEPIGKLDCNIFILFENMSELCFCHMKATVLNYTMEKLKKTLRYPQLEYF
jgi:hypothetical protein